MPSPDVRCTRSPLHLVPTASEPGGTDLRRKVAEYTGADVDGQLCPLCAKRLETEFDGDFSRFPIMRVRLSESRRVGIGTFAPSDPKSMSTEQLTGGVNFKLLETYGSDDDPRALDWAGEFSKANRGVLECIEFLKNPKEFLVEFLTLSQERQFKVPKFGFIDADLVLLAHTNETEFRQRMADPTNEALQSRLYTIPADAADKKFLHRVRAGADRIEQYARTHGRDVVDDFVDDVQAIAVHAPDQRFRRVAPAPPSMPAIDPYADLFPEAADASRVAHEQEVAAWHARFPREPEEDLLGFVAQHAHRLEDWQRDVISILREETAYFAPQQRTKIANEGFACWTHLQIVQQMHLPTDEFVAFAKLNAGVIQPDPLQVNPYNVGHELWCEIERIYDDPSPEERDRYAGTGQIRGGERVLELASTMDDVSLVAAFLTCGVCERTKLFARKRDRPGRPDRNDRNVLRTTSREADEVRAGLLRELTTGGGATPRGRRRRRRPARHPVALPP